MAVKIRKKTIDWLKRAVEKDYKISINDNEANELGVCLLRLSRLALIGLARTKEMKKIIKYKNKYANNKSNTI